MNLFSHVNSLFNAEPCYCFLVQVIISLCRGRLEGLIHLSFFPFLAQTLLPVSSLSVSALHLAMQQNPEEGCDGGPRALCTALWGDGDSVDTSAFLQLLRSLLQLLMGTRPVFGRLRDSCNVPVEVEVGERMDIIFCGRGKKYLALFVVEL